MKSFKWKSKFTIIGSIVAICGGLLLLQFQNCGSQQVGNGLSLGSASSTSTTGTAAPLTVTLSPLSIGGVAGSNLSFMVSVLGGSSPFSYSWTINGGSGSCPTTSFVCTATYASAGNYSLGVIVTDRFGVSVSSNAAVSITAAIQPLTVSLVPAVTTVTAGTSVSLVANSAGGQTPLTYTWSTVGSSLNCNGSSCTVNYASAVTYNVGVYVTDALGTQNQATSSVVVNAVYVPPPLMGCTANWAKASGVVGSYNSATGLCIFKACSSNADCISKVGAASYLDGRQPQTLTNGINFCNAAGAQYYSQARVTVRPNCGYYYNLNNAIDSAGHFAGSQVPLCYLSADTGIPTISEVWCMKAPASTNTTPFSGQPASGSMNTLPYDSDPHDNSDPRYAPPPPPDNGGN